MKLNKKTLSVSVLFILAGVIATFISVYYNFDNKLMLMQSIILLIGFFLPINYGVACSFIIPILCTLFFRTPELYPQLPLIICEMIAFTSFANIFYKSAHWSIYPSLICTLLMGGLVLFSAASILSWIIDGFSAITYIVESFIDNMQGLVLQIIFIPLILKITSIIRTQKAASA